MKKILLSLGVAVMASMSMMSCSKGDYNSGDAQTGYNPFADVNTKPKVIPTGTFTAKVNGSDFSAAYANAYFNSIAGIESWFMVGFKTGMTASDGFILTTSKKEVGVYNIDLMGGSDNSAIFNAVGSSSSVIAETGTIEITVLTEDRVKGKFSMKAPGLDVTDGTFDLPIIKYSDYYK